MLPECMFITGENQRFMPIAISNAEFNTIRDISYHHFGIRFSDAKKSLIESRIHSLLLQHNFDSYGEYLAYLQNDQEGIALPEFIARMTTNHSYFYRENDHLNFLVGRALPPILKKLQNNRQYDLRIWSAGCATGEEPYMLVMMMMDLLGNEYQRWNAGVLATDISEKALAIAKEGLYPEGKINLVPENLKRKYFSKQSNGQWAVSNKVREQVVFRNLNLMSNFSVFKNRFHIIFSRNVMIYFDTNSREILVNKFFRQTVEEGYLFVGLSESLRGEASPYRYIQPGVYQKPVETTSGVNQRGILNRKSKDTQL